MEGDGRSDDSSCCKNIFSDSIMAQVKHASVEQIIALRSQTLKALNHTIMDDDDIERFRRKFSPPEIYMDTQDSNKNWADRSTTSNIQILYTYLNSPYPD
ncbi:hypothetical protein HNY73_010134 [Argiope bruennichi]|uniref:Uncharacterized protein n=1 Tax=Argiope bruennichi TaxID=94029 RepID=A0A8T0F4X9_ARGBR|nr:hypothetical protein HNY73_010134 [Argiope bruennichi]